jgi:hypothetical protein
MLILIGIILNGVFGYLKAAWYWFYGAIYGIITYLYQVTATFLGRKWLMITAVSLVLWLILIIISVLQVPSMQLFDQLYSCIFLRPAQLLMAFAMTFTETGWVFLSSHWNDAVFVFRDCVNFFINLLRVLPGLDNLGFYTGAVEATYELLECIILIPFNVQSWMLPYGATGTISFFVRNVLCLTRFLTFLLTTTTDFTIFRNDISVCMWDPNATSVGRAFGSLGRFEVALPPTIIGEENCTKGVQVDCDYLSCMIYSMSNFTEPIQETTGVNLTAIAEELTEPVCCFVSSFYKAPTFLILALLPSTRPPFISIADAPDWLLDNMLSPIADCFIEIFFVLSRGTIDDIWELIFSAIFEFVQMFIDSYDFLVQCFGLQSMCMNEFPDSCRIRFTTGIAFAGLQTCFRDFGDCIVDGNPDEGIPPNPIINGIEFGPLFQDVIPSILAIYDSIACNYVPFQQCIHGPNFTNNFPTTLPECPTSSSSLGRWQTQMECLTFCWNNRVPLIRPMSVAVRSAIGAIAGLVRGIYDIGEEIYSIIEEACDIINSIPMIGGCNVPPFPETDLRDDGGYRRSKRQKRETPRFQTLKDALDHHQIYREDNICSNVLYEYANADLAGDEERLHEMEKDFSKTMSYHICVMLLGTGSKYEEKYPFEISVKRVLDFHYTFEELNKILAIKRRETQSEGGSTNLYSEAQIASELNGYNSTNGTQPYLDLKGMDRYRHLRTENYKNPNTWLFEPRHRISDADARSKRNEAITKREQDTTVNFMSHLFDKVTSHVLEMEGVKLTTGFLGYIHRVNVYYRKVNYGKDKLMNLNNKFDLSTINFGDFITEDDPYYRHLLQTASSWMAPYPEASNAWEIEANNLHRQKFLEQMTLDYFSLWKNHMAGVFEDSSYRIEVRKKLRAAGYLIHNNKIKGKNAEKFRNRNIKDLTHAEISSLIDSPVSDVVKMSKALSIPRKSVTLNDIKDKQRTIRTYEKKLKHAYKSLSRAGAHISSDAVMGFVYKDELYKTNRYAQAYHILTKRDGNSYGEDREIAGELVARSEGHHADQGDYLIFGDPGYINNVTKYFAGYISYDMGRGFISNEEAKQIEMSRDNSSLFLWQMMKGEYNPREKGERIGPMFTDPDKTWIDFRGMTAAWKRGIKQMKLNYLTAMYDGEVPPQAFIDFRLSSIDSTVDTWVIDLLKWLLNDIFESLTGIFLRLGFDFRIDRIILNWIDSFDPVEIATDVGLETKSYFSDLIECNIPEDFNGTNPYKIGCFPFLPEGMVSDWAVGIGEGNPYMPLQLGIWPLELIDRECVNTFNGDNDIFNFRFIDNCAISDGQPRPLCPVCDYCEAEYFTCQEVGRNGIVPSLFFILGIIPVLLQEFYTGAISLIFVQRFYNFFLLWVSGMGTTNIPLQAPVYAIMLGTTYSMTRFLSVTFSRFPGFGEDELPIGAIYIFTLIAFAFFVPILTLAFPAWVVAFVLVGLAITWLVNLFIPFEGIRATMKLSIWIGQAFEFLDLAPQPMKPVPWTSAVEASIAYDYSGKAVPYLDVFCFFWTTDKLLLMGLGMFLMMFVIQGSFQLVWPTWLFVVDILQNTSTMISSARFWQLKENVRDLLGDVEKLREDVKALQVVNLKGLNAISNKSGIKFSKSEFKDMVESPMIANKIDVERLLKSRLAN